MAKATLVVMTNPVSSEVEDEYNDWYDNVHLQDLVAVDGVASAQRFRVLDIGAPPDAPSPSHRYLALYEVEADDLEAVAQEVARRAEAGEMVITPALDAQTARVFWVEPMGVPVVSG